MEWQQPELGEECCWTELRHHLRIPLGLQRRGLAEERGRVQGVGCWHNLWPKNMGQRFVEFLPTCTNKFQHFWPQASCVSRYARCGWFGMWWFASTVVFLHVQHSKRWNHGWWYLLDIYWILLVVGIYKLACIWTWTSGTWFDTHLTHRSWLVTGHCLAGGSDLWNHPGRWCQAPQLRKPKCWLVGKIPAYFLWKKIHGFPVIFFQSPTHIFGI